MNKVFKIGSLVLAGAIFVGVGCNKEAEKQKEEAGKKANMDDAKKIGTNGTTTAPTVGSVMKSVEDEGKKEKEKVMGTTLPTSMPSMGM